VAGREGGKTNGVSSRIFADPEDLHDTGLKKWTANAAHIARLDPATVSELCRLALIGLAIDAKVEGPVVKALKWNGSRAESICGNYYIEANGASVWTWYLYDRSRRIGYIFATPDQAKAAAQADYEARILSALATPTAANASEGDGPNLTAYEAQVLIGTSISGCAMSPGSTFALTPAWVRLHKLGLIDRTDGLAIATEDGVKLIAAMLAAAPASPDTKEQQP
jgi:hypothetical protein